MRIAIIVITLALHHFVIGQNETKTKVIETTKNFSTVRDSILNLINPNNSIIIKTCEGSCEFYLTKDSLYWTGYYIKNLLSIKSLPVFENDEVKHNLIQTTSITFNADNLYNKLLNLNTYDIEQLTENTLQNNYIGENKTTRKNVTIQYSLPHSSHDCNMTITTNDSKHNTVTYRNVLIEDENLHRIKTIKIFHDIKQLLINEFENYQSGQ